MFDRPLTLLFVLSLWPAEPIPAQVAADSLGCTEPWAHHGSIRGHITHASGGPVTGAIVGAARHGGLYCFATSDSSGAFLLPAIGVGESHVVGRLASTFSDVVRVTVSLGVESAVELVLAPSPPDPSLREVRRCRQTPQTEFVVRGLITDASTGLPVPEALVHPADDSCGTLSDELGRYAIALAIPDSMQMMAHYIGSCDAARRWVRPNSNPLRLDIPVPRDCQRN